MGNKTKAACGGAMVLPRATSVLFLLKQSKRTSEKPMMRIFSDTLRKRPCSPKLALTSGIGKTQTVELLVLNVHV